MRPALLRSVREREWSSSASERDLSGNHGHEGRVAGLGFRDCAKPAGLCCSDDNGVVEQSPIPAVSGSSKNGGSLARDAR